MRTQKILLLAGAVVFIGAVLAGGFYLFPTEEVRVDYTLTGIKEKTYSGSMPSLDREVIVSDSLPQEVKDVLRKKVADDQARLKRVPYDGNVWMDLALQYHSANDYDGAREVWEFVVALTPTNVTALDNLGRLYHFDLKNYELAEKYFRQAIVANPERPEAYYELFDLYRYSYKKDTSAAVDIMKEAAKVFPDDIGIPAGLGTYYREQGSPNKARSYFEQALTLAREQSNLSLVQALTRELSTLP